MSVTSGLFAGAVSGVAFGDFTTTRYTSGTSYELAISHVVDFDQVRTLLPADSTTGIPGANYCVPTSGANLCAYIANHGRPGVTPERRIGKRVRITLLVHRSSVVLAG